MADPQTVQTGPDQGMPLVGGFNELADKIRKAHPGAYDDLNDMQLTQAVLKKYPQYQDLSLPYDAKIKRGDQWVPVRASSLQPDERLQATEYHPPDADFWKHTYQGAKAGAMVATSPMAIGASLPQLAGGLVGGTVGSTAGSYVAKKAGAGEFGQEVAGDVGGVAGGALGAGAANWLTGKAVAAFKALPTEIQKEFVGIMSPRALHALRLAKALKPGVEEAAVYPGAPLPANPPPEYLNPALNSPTRTLPGMHSPEVINPPAPPTAAPIPSRTGLLLGAPETPAVYPGAPLPAAPPPQVAQARGLAQGGKSPIDPSGGLGKIPIAQPKVAPPAPPSEPIPTGSGAGIPRTLQGESAMRQILTGQDNANLLKIAKSRGINVTQEAQLKPGVADGRLITKIIDDLSQDELKEIGDKYLETTRMGMHKFGDVGAEAWKTMSLKNYFPDVKISQAVLNRVAKVLLPKGISEEDLSPILLESLKRVQARGQ